MGLPCKVLQQQCAFGNQGLRSHPEEAKKTVRATPVRHSGDVTEAETHQAADVEVMKMHQCESEHRGVLKECQ